MALAIAVSVGAPRVVPAQHFPPASELEALVRKRLDDVGVGGIVLGVMEADGSTTIVTAGSAGPDTRPLGERTLFEIGSLTKTFTAALLVDMANRGEVSLDDPVARHLPPHARVPTRNGREITLVDLSTHHSALPQMPDNIDPADPLDPFADYTPERLYEFLSGHVLRRDIGSEFEYSNVGVGLLGHVLSLRAGRSYEAVVRARILEPIGMSSSGIELVGEMPEYMAKGHAGSGAAVPPWNLNALAGAGGIRSDMRDMLLYLDANLGPPESPIEEVLRATHAERRTIEGSISIGLAWQTRRVGDSRIVWHDGGTGGFSAFIGFDPDREVGAVVLANSTVPVNDIAFHVINRELPLRELSVLAEAVAVTGLLIVAAGLLGVAVPRTLLRLADRGSCTRTRFHASALLCGAVGALFVYAAPRTFTPLPIFVIGGLFVVAAIAVPIVGFDRLRERSNSWTERSPSVIRALSLLPIALGVLMVYWSV